MHNHYLHHQNTGPLGYAAVSQALGYMDQHPQSQLAFTGATNMQSG